MFSARENCVLKKAREVKFPFEVTGYLISPKIINRFALGRIHAHIKADFVTGRFTDGHLIHTSDIADFIMHRGFIVLITRNSSYVCCFPDLDDELPFVKELNAFPRPTRH